MSAFPPPHEPTDETRARVREVLAAGGTRADAAAAIGVSDETLRRRYADVLVDYPPGQNPPPEGGRFRPGESGNPAGESKSTAEFRKACRALAAGGLDEARRRLLDPDTPAPAFVSLWTALRDTGYGKPKESIEHSGPDGGPIPVLSAALPSDLSRLDAEELAKLYRTLLNPDAD